MNLSGNPEPRDAYVRTSVATDGNVPAPSGPAWVGLAGRPARPP
jgi:hypothetical protein